jgi:putative FmdB family regulatory protein
MPQYDYRCEDCGKKFSLYLAMAEKDRARKICPKCGGRKAKQLFSGFYAKTSKKS